MEQKLCDPVLDAFNKKMGRYDLSIYPRENGKYFVRGIRANFKKRLHAASDAQAVKVSIAEYQKHLLKTANLFVSLNQQVIDVSERLDLALW